MSVIRYLLFVATLIFIQPSLATTPEESPQILCYEYSDPAQESPTKKSFKIDKLFGRVANFFFNLDISPLFNVKKLLHPPAIQEELLNPKLGGGQDVNIKLCGMIPPAGDTDQTIECTFFDRKSSALLIIATGFGNEKEKVAPFVHAFPNYDIVIFNYRGHGYKQPKLLDVSRWTFTPTEVVKKIITTMLPFIDKSRIPNIDLSKTTMGEKEDQDLLAVINHFRKQREYEKLYGLGLCFSSNIMSKVAAQNPNLFDKLIFDSSLYSMQKLIKRITKHPQLILDPQRGEWPVEMASPTGGITKTVSKFLKRIFSNFFIGKKRSKNKTTAEYLSQLPKETPVLFVHGKKDVMTLYDEDFLKNFDESELPNKVGIVFEDGKHLVNVLKFKNEYACIGNMFFDLPFDNFKQCLKDPKAIVDYKFDELKSRIYDNRVPFSTSPDSATTSKLPAESLAQSIIP